jgi:hypothetical protein
MGLKKVDPGLGQIAAMFEELWSHPCLTLLGGDESGWARVRPTVQFMAEEYEAQENAASETMDAVAGMKFAAAELLAAVNRDDADGAAIAALRLGVCFYRTFYEVFEQKIRMVHRMQAGGKKGHENAYGSAEKRHEEYRRWQDLVDGRMGRNPVISYTEACRQVARTVKKCFETITRNTTHPRRKPVTPGSPKGRHKQV